VVIVLNEKELKYWFDMLYVNPVTLRPEDITNPGCITITDLSPFDSCNTIGVNITDISKVISEGNALSVIMCLKDRTIATVLFGFKVVQQDIRLLTSAGEVNINKVVRIIELPWLFDYFNYYT